MLRTYSTDTTLTYSLQAVLAPFHHNKSKCQQLDAESSLTNRVKALEEDFDEEDLVEAMDIYTEDQTVVDDIVNQAETVSIEELGPLLSQEQQTSILMLSKV